MARRAEGRARIAIRAGERAGVVKRSLSIKGHATSISLEEPFWHALKQLAGARGLSLAALVADIDGARGHSNLSSALRVHVLEALQAAVAQDCFDKAGRAPLMAGPEGSISGPEQGPES